MPENDKKGKPLNYAEKANGYVTSEFLDKEFSELIKKNKNDTIDKTDYVTHIIHRQKMPFELRLGNAIKVSFTSMPTVLYTGGGMVDHITTYTRSFQVYSNIWANFTYTGEGNNAAENPMSAFYKLLTTNGESSTVTDVGWAAFAFGLVALPAGMAREVYRMYRKNTVESLEYHKRRLKQIGVEYENDDELNQEIEEYYLRFYENGKVFNRLKKKPVYEIGKARADFKNETLDRLVGLFSGKINIEEREQGFLGNVLDFLGADYEFSKQTRKREWYEQLISVIALATKKIWDAINDLGYTYWLVWFAFVTVIGITAASVSVFYAPIIIGITLGLGLLYNLPRMIAWIINSEKSEKKLMRENEEKELNDEIDRMAAELKYRHFMRKEHHYLKQYFFDNDETIKNEPKIKRVYSRHAAPKILSRNKKKVANSRLAKYLLKGSSLRIGLAVGIDVVMGIILTSFAFWVLSASIFAFAGAAIPIVVFLDSGVNSGIAGLIIGALSGFKKYIEMKQAQNNYEKRVHEKLCEQYKDTNQTKGEFFDKLENDLKLEKERAEGKRSLLIRLYEGKNISASDMETVLASKYNLDQADVYNHEYREKQRHETGLWTKVKRFGGFVFNSLADIQTGSLLTRTLLVKGAIFGSLFAGGFVVSAATGTLPVFFIVAALVITVYTGASLYLKYLEKERQHQENFLDNIDGNISYLNKKVKEVKLLNKYLDNRLNAVAKDENMLVSKKSVDKQNSRRCEVVPKAEAIQLQSNGLIANGLHRPEQQPRIDKEVATSSHNPGQNHPRNTSK